MPRGPLLAVGAAALAAAGFLLAAMPLGARNSALPAGNIVLNPGFEEGQGSTDGHFVSASLPRWHRQDASTGFTAVRYGATGSFPGTAARDDVSGQTNFAAGGPRNHGEKQVEIDQTIDLSDWGTEIDKGDVQARLTAYIGGYLTDADTGRVTFEQYGAPNDRGFSQLFASTVLGPVDAGDRGNQTKLLRRTATVAVHAGARRLKVLLDAFPTSGTYTNVFFDNVSVELFSGAPPPTGGTSTGGTTTKSGTTGTTGTSTSRTTTTPPPKKPPAKAALSLSCARHRLVATVKPAKGSKIVSVRFAVNGKAKPVDRKAPFALAVSTKGLKKPVKVTAAVQLAKSKTSLAKLSARGCA